MPTDWSDIIADPAPFKPNLKDVDPAMLAAMIGSSMTDAQVSDLEGKMKAVMDRADARQKTNGMLDLLLRVAQFAVGKLV